MAQLFFYAGEGFQINNLGGSGLGFYGPGFGYSVPVGEYQDTTFITDANGVNQGPQVDNIKFLNNSSGIVNGAGSGVHLRQIPNYLAPLNIRFNHSSPIKTQNVKVRVYDRLNINNGPSGVTFKVAEIVHPDQPQILNGSGSSTWTTLYGSGSVLTCTASPGLSGLRPNGPMTTDMNHDWYFAITGSPDSVGSKLAALYMELEYL